MSKTTSFTKPEGVYSPSVVGGGSFWLGQFTLDYSSFKKISENFKNNYNTLKIYTTIEYVTKGIFSYIFWTRRIVNRDEQESLISFYETEGSGAGFTLPNRSPEPPAVGFGKPDGKPRLPLKTDQIQIPNWNASSFGSAR
jgi:hypothetical protein